MVWLDSLVILIPNLVMARASIWNVYSQNMFLLSSSWTQDNFFYLPVHLRLQDQQLEKCLDNMYSYYLFI